MSEPMVRKGSIWETRGSGICKSVRVLATFKDNGNLPGRPSGALPARRWVAYVYEGYPDLGGVKVESDFRDYFQWVRGR